MSVTLRVLGGVAALAAGAAPGLVLADPIPGTLIIDMRLRGEFVDQDGLPENAQAVTLRTRLGWETPAWKGFKALVEGENVAALDEDYNSTLNGKVRFPVVSDPPVTQMNRLQLHIFQGWADVFLTTPPSGVHDLNLNAGATVTLGPKAPPLKLQAAFHDFTADDGSARYGRELDLLAGAPLTKSLAAELKAAFFDGARPGFADRSKVWMTLEYRY